MASPLVLTLGTPDLCRAQVQVCLPMDCRSAAPACARAYTTRSSGCLVYGAGVNALHRDAIGGLALDEVGAGSVERAGTRRKWGANYR